MRRFTALVLLLPALALAGVGGSSQRGRRNPVAASTFLRARYAFATPGCYPSGTVTISRASVATYLDAGGALQTCSANQLRVTPTGALIEAAGTNYVSNAATHPKTAQATAALPTGAFVAWTAGSGTFSVAAGTAVVTGLTCSGVAAGTPCTFTVTTGGTMSITTSAGITLAQIEAGSLPSSFIPTTTAPGTRAADAVTVPGGMNPSAWCVAGTYTPNGPWASTARGLYSTGSYHAANSLRSLMSATSYVYLDTTDAAAGQKEIHLSIGGGMASGSSHRIVGCDQAGTLRLYLDGTLLVTNGSGTGSGVLGTIGALSLGDDSTGFILNGTISDFRICKRGTPGGDCK